MAIKRRGVNSVGFRLALSLPGPGCELLESPMRPRSPYES
jgi:hypothetical protein